MSQRKVSKQTVDFTIKFQQIPNNASERDFPYGNLYDYDGTHKFKLDECWDNPPSSPKTFTERFNNARKEYYNCQQDEVDHQPEVEVENPQDFYFRDEDMNYYSSEDEDTYNEPLGHYDYRYLNGYLKGHIDEEYNRHIELAI